MEILAKFLSKLNLVFREPFFLKISIVCHKLLQVVLKTVVSKAHHDSHVLLTVFS